MSDSVIYVVSLVLLIGVCGLGFWFARQSLGISGVPLFTPKQRRLGVIEAAAVDGRRRLILVRRDNVEHLVLIGGPMDLVLETGIPARPAIIGVEPQANGSLSVHEAQLGEAIPLTLNRDQAN